MARRVVAGADGEGGLGLPGVDEAMDLVEVGGADVVGDEPGGTPGADGAELERVADPEKLGAGGLGLGAELVELAAGHHADLVDDDEVAGAHLPGRVAGPVAALGQPAGDVVRRDAGRAGKHVCRRLGNGKAGHPAAICRPHFGKRPDGRGLAGSCRSDQHLEHPSRTADRPQGRGLVRPVGLAAAGATVEDPVGDRRGDGQAGIDSSGGGHDAGLGGQDAGGAVPGAGGRPVDAGAVPAAQLGRDRHRLGRCNGA